MTAHITIMVVDTIMEGIFQVDFTITMVIDFVMDTTMLMDIDIIMVDATVRV